MSESRPLDVIEVDPARDRATKGQVLERSSVLAATSDVLADPTADEALALAAAADRQAFETLYLRHRLDLFRYARARTGDDESAADVVSATFERALAAISDYRSSGGGFRAWLFRIARNQVIDASRRRRTADRHAPSLQVVGAEQPSPEHDLLREESMAQLRGLVARLPDTQRDAVLLRYASGLTTHDIAVTLGRSDAAVQKLITRALASLKETYRAIDR